MPGLCQTHSPVMSMFPIDDELYSPAYGPEAEYLASILDEIRLHTLQRAESLIRFDESMDDTLMNHKYLKPTRTVRTKYKYVGKLKPRKFIEDD